MMKIKIKNPVNIRIVHESVYAGIFVILLLWLTMPFNVETIHEGRPLFFLPQGIITTVISIVLTVFGGFFFCDNPIEPWWNGGHIHLDYFYQYIYYVSATCIFLYIGTYVRNRNWHLRFKLEEVRTINALLEERQKNIAEESEMGKQKAEDRQSDSAPQCHLVGNTGNSTLSLPPENIIYVESMSNYADICYMEDDEVRHKMLRITLKQIKECIADNKFMVQCHRAFIVNLNFVVTITNRNSGYLLQIFGTDKQIPVSRTYTAAVKESLQVSAK